MADTLTNLLFHIVYSTKDREPLIRLEFRDELEKYIAGIVRNEGGILLGIGGMPDHLHLVTKFKPDRSVADMVRLIKANSSKWVNEEHGEPGRFAWQTGYGVRFPSANPSSKCCSPMSPTRKHTIEFGRSRMSIVSSWSNTAWNSMKSTSGGNRLSRGAATSYCPGCQPRRRINRPHV